MKLSLENIKREIVRIVRNAVIHHASDRVNILCVDLLEDSHIEKSAKEGKHIAAQSGTVNGEWIAD